MCGIVKLNIISVIENKDRIVEVNAMFPYVFGIFLIIPLKKQTATPSCLSTFIIHMIATAAR